jgi:hypothetical protein
MASSAAAEIHQRFGCLPLSGAWQWLNHPGTTIRRLMTVTDHGSP